MSDSADIVIAGAGHNALITAAYLAKSGLKVIVLEGRDVIGGGATTEELTLPGFLHDPYSTGHFGMMGNPIFTRDELPLAKYGLSYIAPDPVVVLPTNSGSIAIWHDENRTASEFAKHSTADARAWRQLCRDWTTLAPVFIKTVGNPPAAPSAPSRGLLAQLAAHIRLGRRVLSSMSPAEATKMQAIAAASALDVIEQRFESPEVRMIMTWLVAITCQPIDKPGTGPLALALPVPMARAAWVNAVGGAIALPNALAAYVIDNGGEVITNARVTRVVMKQGRAAGFETEDGREYTATKAAVSSLHFTELPKLAPNFQFPGAYLDGVQRWEVGAGLFLVHLALDRNPTVRSGNSDVPSVLTGSITQAGVRRQLADVEMGKAPVHDDIWLLAACSTIVDPSRAPEGRGVVKLMTMVPHELEGDPANWDSYKYEFADHLVKLYARLVKGYSPGEELARTVVSPADIAATNPNFLGGSPQGGHAMPSQAGINRPVAGWSSYRSPIPGLFQTGLSTHPGGAVNGWAGRNAARAVLFDLGMDVDRLVPPV